MTWQPPTIVQPTFGHPYCDRCGAVIVEEAVQRHVEWHRTIHDGRKASMDAILLLTLKVMPESVAGLDMEAIDALTAMLEQMKEQHVAGAQ